MRILHCIPSMGGGGAERQLSYLLNQMSEDGHEVHLIYFEDGVNGKHLNLPENQIHKLACLNNYDPMIILKIIYVILSIKPQIVQTWISQIDILAGIASIITKTPFILSERSSAKGYGLKWKDKLRITVGKRASAIVANSKEGAGYWEDKVKKPFLKVIKNAIPFRKISEEKKGEKEVILFAGRYDKEKNLYNLLDAVNLVLQKRKQSEVFFFGDGPQKESLVRYKNQFADKDRIKIMDYTNDLWDWINAAKVFVSVSLYEGTPNTILEAVSLKCPVVISDIPAHRELLDEDSAYFVSVTDKKSIADGIVRAVSEYQAVRLKVENAYKKIEGWSVKSIAREYIEFYNFLLSQL